jgi:hypothetical protein
MLAWRVRKILYFFTSRSDEDSNPQNNTSLLVDVDVAHVAQNCSIETYAPSLKLRFNLLALLLATTTTS